jgi:hypothetical protein
MGHAFRPAHSHAQQRTIMDSNGLQRTARRYLILLFKRHLRTACSGDGGDMTPTNNSDVPLVEADDDVPDARPSDTKTARAEMLERDESVTAATPFVRSDGDSIPMDVRTKPVHRSFDLEFHRHEAAQGRLDKLHPPQDSTALASVSPQPAPPGPASFCAACPRPPCVSARPSRALACSDSRARRCCEQARG